MNPFPAKQAPLAFLARLALLIFLLCPPLPIKASSFESRMRALGSSFSETLMTDLLLAFSLIDDVSTDRLDSAIFRSIPTTESVCYLIEECRVTDPIVGYDWVTLLTPPNQSMHDAYPDLFVFPAAAGALVPVFSLPGINSQFKLSLWVLGEIFRACETGEPNCVAEPSYGITRWSDPHVLKLNKHLTASEVNILHQAGRIHVMAKGTSCESIRTWRSAIAARNDAFKEQFGNYASSQEPLWPGATIKLLLSDFAIAGMLSKNPGSISYIPWQVALDARLQIARLESTFFFPNGLPISDDTMESAVGERGLNVNTVKAFSPNSLVVDLYGTVVPESWPFMIYSYFAVRLNTTTRAGETCPNRAQTLRWFEWFYNSSDAEDIVRKAAFVSVPKLMSKYVIRKLRKSLECNGELACDDLAYQPVAEIKPFIEINVKVSRVLNEIALAYSIAYANRASSTIRFHISLLSDDALNHNVSRELFDNDTSVAIVSYNYLKKLDLNLYSVHAFAARGVGFVFNFCNLLVDQRNYNASLDAIRKCTVDHLIELILTPQVGVDILQGHIQRWDDPRLVMLQSPNAQPLPAQPIRVFRYSDQDFTGRLNSRMFASILKRRLNLDAEFELTYTTEPIDARTRDEMRDLILATPFSIGIASLWFDSVSGIRNAMMRLDGSSVVALRIQPETLKACFNSQITAVAQEDTSMSTKSNDFKFKDPAQSKELNCWPLTQSVYFVLPKKRYCDSECKTNVPQFSVRFAQFAINQTHSLEVKNAVGVALNDGTSLNEVTCYDQSILFVQTNNQYIPVGLIWTMRTLAILLILILLVLGVFIWRKKYEPIVLASTPKFQLMMIVGFAIQVCAVFTLSMEDNYSFGTNTQEMLDVACMATPWLLFTGMIITFAPLAAKTYRIYRIFGNPQQRSVRITEGAMAIVVVLACVPVIVACLAWTIVDPLHWVRAPVEVDEFTGIPRTTLGSCTGNNVLEYVVTLTAYVILVILINVWLAWMNRNASTDFSEGRYVAVTFLVYLEFIALGIPIVVTAYQDPTASFVVKCVLILITVTLAATIFWFPKIAIVLHWWKEDSNRSSATVLLGLSPANVASVAVGRDDATYFQGFRGTHITTKPKSSTSDSPPIKNDFAGALAREEKRNIR